MKWSILRRQQVRLPRRKSHLLLILDFATRLLLLLPTVELPLLQPTDPLQQAVVLLALRLLVEFQVLQSLLCELLLRQLLLFVLLLFLVELRPLQKLEK